MYRSTQEYGYTPRSSTGNRRLDLLFLLLESDDLAGIDYLYCKMYSVLCD